MTPDICETAFHLLPLPVFIVQDGFFRYVNPKMIEISGYSQEDLVDKPCFGLVYTEDQKTMEDNYSLRINGEKIEDTYLFRVLDPRGGVRYLEGYFSNIQYNGRPASLGQFIDVTRPNKLRQELTIQKAHFQQLFANAPQAIAMLDAHDRFVDINGGFERLFQYTIGEVRGIPINDVIVPEVFQEEASHNSRSVYDGRIIQVESIRKRKDGSLVHVSLIGYPVVVDDQHIGMYAIYQDITERKRVEEKIRESEEKYRQVFENAPLGIFHYDRNGILTAVNDNFVDIIGSSAEALVGLNTLTLPYKEIVAAVNKSLSGSIGSFEGDYRAITSGKVTPVKVYFAPIVVEGKTAGGVGIVEDITERKLAHDELFKEKERLAVTLSSIGDAVIAVDRLGLVTMINPVAQSLTGWSQGDAMGRPLEEVFEIVNEYTGDPVENPVQKVINEGRTIGLANHTALISREGNRVSIADSAAPIRDVAGEMLGVILVFRDMTLERQKEEALRKSEERFRGIVESTDDWVWEVDIRGLFTYVSPQIKNMLGYSPEEVVGKTIFDLMSKEEAGRVYSIFRSCANQLASFRSMELTIFHRDGRPVFLETNGAPFFTDGKYCGYSGIIRDITQRKLAEKKLSLAHRQLQDIIEFLPDATFVVDKNKRIIAWNRAIEEMSGAPKEEMIGKGDFAYAVPFYGRPRPLLIDLIFSDYPGTEEFYDYVERKGDTLFAEVFIPSINKHNGGYIWIKASPLFDRDGNFVGAICSIRDISQRKEIEERLKYLSLHDPLTGLYNRAYFEEEMRRLEGGRHYPVSIILCDVDGLKLVNDSLGHDAGDSLLMAAADVSRRSFEHGVIMSRIGGDEFAVLLPGTDREVVESYCIEIRENLNKYNKLHPDLPLSLSVGFATAVNDSTSLMQVFKEADNNMYREKLYHSQSARSAIVSTLMKALEARDFITEGHADRIQDLVEDMALVMGLSERKANELRLFAQFHDIGKVGIPDRILFKSGPLTGEEYNEMKRHCEIGYRIAQSAPDLASIADWILKHHEWWNGKGYPLMLREQEIPLECRILSIADAYDAMTSDRPYRKAMNREEALAELERCAGIQFDPGLVKVFIKLLEGQ